MKMELVASVQARIRAVVRDVVAAQRREGDKEVFRISQAAKLLGSGWSVSNIRIAMGRKMPKRPDQLPQSAALLQLCIVADVNAEWLFTGEGPRYRSAYASGGGLSAEDLGRELGAHLLSHCSIAYPNEKLYVDGDQLLQDLTRETVIRAHKDAEARTHRLEEINSMERMLAQMGRVASLGSPDRDRARDAIRLRLRELRRLLGQDAINRRTSIFVESDVKEMDGGVDASGELDEELDIAYLSPMLVYGRNYRHTAARDAK